MRMAPAMEDRHMHTQLRMSLPAAIALSGLLATVNAAAAESPWTTLHERKGTVQSELDYLRSAKLSYSIKLRDVTIRQAYEQIAKETGLTIAYEGALNLEGKHELSFTNVTLKDILGKLGTKFNLSYRVDGPDKLTVVGAIPKRS
jgi:hypothetical protein